MTKWLTAALLLCMTTMASASVTILQNSGVGNPDENILFTGGNVVPGPGYLVTGESNSSSWLLDFTSTDKFVGTGGQSRIKSSGQAAFSDLTMLNFRESVTAAVLDILDLEFNIVAKNNGSVRIDIYDDSLGSNLLTTGSYAVSKNGQNKFRLTANDLSGFGKVVLTSLNGDNFTELKQPRISGQLMVVVPEPASIAVWACLGLVGIPYSIYRRHRATTASSD